MYLERFLLIFQDLIIIHMIMIRQLHLKCCRKGNYVYKISYKKDGKEVVAKTVSVTVKEATDTTATAWRLDVANDNADIVVGKM